MKYKTREEAEKAANICRDMIHKPNVWELEVWESIGWRWRLNNGVIRVTDFFFGKTLYDSYISLADEDISVGEWDRYLSKKFNKLNENPNRSVDIAIKQYMYWYVNKMDKLNQHERLVEKAYESLY